MQELKISNDILEKGFYSSVDILSKKECKDFLRRIEKEPKPVDWWKGRAVNSAAFHKIANHGKIVDLARTVLGPDVLLWGASIVTRKRGEIHPWHCDIETSSSYPGKTLSVWIGLKNTRKSSLKLISYSHKFSRILQQAAYENDKKRGHIKDKDVLRWSREENNKSKLVTTRVKDGNAIFFDGRLWHSSYNKNILGTRKALLLQYASPDTEIRKFSPKNLNWPFNRKDKPLAPCVLISGTDRYKVNKVPEPRF